MGRKVTVSMVLILLVILGFGYSEAQVRHIPFFNPPWASWNITSSYGPRDVNSGSYFHKGIDYAGGNNFSFGTSIRAIEDGSITEISKMAGRGYYITYGSNESYPENGNWPNQWNYFHMFSDDSRIVTSTKWEYSTDYKFVYSIDASKVYNANTIIKWLNKEERKAEQVLCVVERNGYYVRDNAGNYVLNSIGDRILAKSNISKSDYIGPVGCSSGAAYTLPTHLHVALNDQNDNPLYYLTHKDHGYRPGTDAKFTIPADSVSISPLNESALTYRLKSDIITSINKNYDLDRVEFLVDNNLLSGNNIDTSLPGYSTLKSKFVFGGLPDVNPNGTPYPDWITSKSRMSSNDTVTGVHPLKDSDSTPTNFRFIWNADLCNLPPGGHRFTVKAVDVNGYITTNGTDFTIGVVVGTNPGDDYSTIQAAINAAGDSCRSRKICVRDGIYQEHINYNGKAVWLRSEHGAGHTTIDGSGAAYIETLNIWGYTVQRIQGSVVAFVNSERYSSVLDGFTITKGSGTVYDWEPYMTYGGGIYCKLSSPTITNCIISGNTAINNGVPGEYSYGYGYGGGIYCESSSPDITNCTISTNTATYGGGGILCYGYSRPNITDCTISGNMATNNFTDPGCGNGGGIFCGFGYQPNITNCTIIGNTAKWWGGGIYSTVDGLGSIANNIISGNTAYGGGGIFCYNNYPINIANCVISNNRAVNSLAEPFYGNGSGGGIFCFSAHSNITNCTISGNTADSDGGGILSVITSVVIRNSILWGNSGEISVNDDLFGSYIVSSSIDVAYSDIQGGYSGTGNISANPMFAGGGDYHLPSGSPCVDAGALTGATTYDLEGNPRLASAGGDSEPDMGAYEYTPPANTSMGQDTSVSMSDSGTTATVTFDSVTHGGQTILTVQNQSQGPTPPSGFQVLGGVYYDISTTAAFTDNIIVGLTYDPTSLTSAQEQALRLLHYNYATLQWEDVTISPDTANYVIYGQVSSLSPFAIGYAINTTPTIIWNNPADIIYGTALDDTQLNAVASVPGTFTYTPAAGTMLNAGSGQILHVDFTPTDTTYNATSADVTINVGRKSASVTLNAAAKTYGDAGPVLTGTLTGFLSGDNVTAAYSRTAGEAAGTYVITASLSPAGILGNYSITYNTADFTITKRPITITADAKNKTYGEPDPALTYMVTNGSLAFNDAFTGSLTREVGGNAGIYAIMQGSLALNGDYTLTYAGANLTINKANQTIVWNNPADIVYGTALGVTQLSAAVSVAGPSPAGALTYTPGAGTVLDIGVRTLTVDAAETENYNSAARSVTIRVIYGFSGLLSPYAADKAYKIKSAIPLKWQYTNNAGAPMDTPAANPTIEISGPYANDAAIDENNIIYLEDTGNSGYQYDSATYTWQFNWKTTGLQPGIYYVRVSCGQSGQVSGWYPATLVTK